MNKGEILDILYSSMIYIGIFIFIMLIVPSVLKNAGEERNNNAK